MPLTRIPLAHHRVPGATALGLACLALLAGCSSDPAEPTGDAGSAGADANAFPLALEQQGGTLELEAPPERVYVIDSWGLDIVTELGVTPVGAATAFEPSPWLADRPELQGVDVGTITDSYPIEQIAATRPDVIVDASGVTAEDPETGDQLTAIAPVVTSPRDYLADSWQDRFLHIGAALGRTDEARAAVRRGDDLLAGIREQHPELEGAALTFGRFDPPASFALIVTERDFTRRFLNEELGFATPAPQVAAYEDGGFSAIGGLIEGVSLENLDLLSRDADAALLWFYDQEATDALQEQPVWQRSPLVTEDRLVTMDDDGAIALRTPTPGSIAWATDTLVPQLVEAVGG